jgi:MmgE/PrpD N-terminal domain
MTTTEDILALAANAAPTAAAVADLALFADAATRGVNSPAVRALRTLRPDHAGPAALPDSPAWRAWLSATAAIAGGDGRHTRYVICAAATAAGQGRAEAAVGVGAAVAVGVGAAALVESRLAGLADPDGWSLPAVSAVIGAGLAAGLMLGLTPPQLRCTLGICATQAAGLHSADSTDAGPLQAGKAAFNAVEAAQLARLGFTSSGEPLDGRRALFALFRT